MSKYIHISFILLCLGCFRPDEYLPKIDSQKLNTSIELSQANYYIQLDYPSTLNRNPNLKWQLKFENSFHEWGIYTNSATPIKIWNTQLNRYDKIDSNILNQGIPKYDRILPNAMQSAIGQWGDFSFLTPESFKDVYIISWNDDTSNQYYKFQLLDVLIDKTYRFKYGPLNEKEGEISEITKDPNFLYSYFNLSEKKSISFVEYPINLWDFQLHYQIDSISKNSKIPYSLTQNRDLGLFPMVSFNHQKVTVYLDTLTAFEDINYFHAKNLPFYEAKHIRGVFFDWDPILNLIRKNPKHQLIIKKEDNYFAIRALTLEGKDFDNLSIELEIKKL